MTQQELQTWAIENDYSDEWLFMADGVKDEEVLNLPQIVKLAREFGYADIKVIHVSEQGTAGQSWKPLDLTIAASSPASSTALAQPQITVSTVAEVRQKKDPGLAAVLSFLIPGLGQIYNGQVIMGIVCALVTIAGYIVVIGFIFHIYLIVDAYKGANRLNHASTR